MGGTSNASRQHANVWAPMEYEAMGAWSWIDWIRFMFYRCLTNCLPCIGMLSLLCLHTRKAHPRQRPAGVFNLQFASPCIMEYL